MQTELNGAKETEKNERADSGLGMCCVLNMACPLENSKN
jgi:hypothetical protein